MSTAMKAPDTLGTTRVKSQVDLQLFVFSFHLFESEYMMAPTCFVGTGNEFIGAAASSLLDVEAYGEAVGLNNHGVTILQRGEYSSAARLFKQASQKIMSAMHGFESSTSSPNPPSPERAFHSSETSTSQHKPRPYKWIKDKSDSSNLSSLETSSFQSIPCVPATSTTFASGESLLFGRPLLMQMPPVDRMDPLQCTSQSSVIVYNLALTFHLHGTIGKAGREALETALELYDVGARLVWVSIRTRPALISPVLLVTLHNMGHIYHGLGGHREAQECSHQLGIVLRMVREGDEHAGCEYERLCLSLLSFTKSIEAAGAA